MKRRGTQLAAVVLAAGLSLGWTNLSQAQQSVIVHVTTTPAQTPTSQPSWWQKTYDPLETPKPGSDGSWVVKGRVSIDESEAYKDAFDRLGQGVRSWLQSQLSVPVDSRWEPPHEMVKALIREQYVDTVAAPESVASETPTMKLAGYKVDFSSASRERFLAAYQHEVAVDRLWKLGAAILGLLVLLGAWSGYIRADEATKGYFTNRLRAAAFMTATAGAGAVYYFFFV